MIHIIMAYIAALLAAILCVLLLSGMFSPLFIALIADIIATAVIFIFSSYHRNSSVYDPYWSLVPPVLALYWLSLHPLAELHPRVFVAFILISLWSVRLTWNWVQRWGGIGDEDWRYQNIRARTGVLYPLADFFGIQLTPTLLVFLACLPFYFMPPAAQAWNLFDLLAILVMGGAIILQTIADNQLRRFLKIRAQGEILNKGVWTYARHPNYFAEVSLWWGVFFFALAAGAPTWTVAGAIAMTLLFVFISVPLMNTRGREKRSDYDAHIKRVRALIPLPKFRFLMAAIRKPPRQ